MTDIAIVAAVRTPIGSFRGAFAPLSAVDPAQRWCAACLNAASCPPQRSTN